MQKKPLRIAVSGASGRIGKLLIKEILQRKDVSLALAISHKNHQTNNSILKNHNITFPIYHSLENTNKLFDVLIDFSHPSGTMKYLKFCKQYNKNIIIGTTGFNTNENKEIQLASEKIKIVLSSNFSIGINLIHNLLKKITVIKGQDSDIEIIEYHHRNKIDSPSGTALEMGKTISESMNLNLINNAIYARYGNLGVRPNKKIGFSSIRAGNIIGKHTVIFANSDEEIEITHKAINRKSFVTGAIKAAIWLQSQKIGLFNMNHVLNFN